MRSTITADVDVDVPVDVAYNQWTQFETFADFMEAVDNVRQVDPTHTHWRVHMGGVIREFDAVITEQLPDHHISWQSTDGALHVGRVDFSPIDAQHTHVELTMEWEPETFTEKVGAVLQLDDLQAARDMRKFKHMIEERGHETGEWRGTIIDSGVAPMTESPEHIAMHRGEHPKHGELGADEHGQMVAADAEPLVDETVEQDVGRDDVNRARLHHDDAHRERRDSDLAAQVDRENPDPDLFRQV